MISGSSSAASVAIERSTRRLMSWRTSSHQIDSAACSMISETSFFTGVGSGMIAL